ncbi:MAG: hypothetical protein PUC29_08360, partial [Clostridia bacterium]|nr:hypothetical protein [Clostridia bacterium]
ADKSKDPKYTVAGHVTAGAQDSEGFDCSLLAMGDKFYFAVSGRAEKLLERCSSYKTAKGVFPLDTETRKKILSYAAALKKHGVTVCAIGFRESPYNSMRRASVLSSNLCFEGFIAVSDRMEQGVADAVNNFREDGGRVIIFSDASSADNDEDKLFCTSEGVFRTGDLYLSEKESAKTNTLPQNEGTLTMIRTPSGSQGIRERLRFTNMCREEGLKTAYVGYGVEDMWSMQRADVSFAVSDPQGNSIPQVLRASADGISDTKAGGFLSSFRMLEKCRGALFNIRNILRYLIVSHSARFILMLICAVASLPLVNAVHLVLWGCILDFITAIAIGSVPSGKMFLKKRECALPNDKSDVLYPTLYGVMCAVLSAAAPFAGRAVISASGREFTLNEQQMVLCMFVSLIIAMPFIAAEFAGRWGLFSSKSLYGKLFVLPFAAAAVIGALSLVSPVLQIPFPGFLMCAFMLIPVTLTVAVMAVIRAAGVKEKTNNYKEV